MRRLLVLSLAMTACAEDVVPVVRPTPTPPPSPVSTSKNRLEARYVQAEGGARRLLDVVDTELGQPCAIGRPDEAGRAVCAPVETAMAVFLDAACTGEPLFEGPDEARGWVLAVGPWAPLGVARLGEIQRTGVEQRYIGGGDHACVPYGAGPSGPLFAKAELRPMSALVGGSVQTATIGDGLALMTFHADDGAELTLERLDPLSGAPCSPASTDAGPRCAPEPATLQHAGLFDSACDKPAIVDYSLPAAVAELVGQDGASLGVHRFENAGRDLGNCVVVSHKADGDSCTFERRNLGRMSYYVGTPYPSSEWPAVALTSEGARIRATEARSPRGAPLEALWQLDPRALFDDQGTPCGPVFVDGVLRCLPAAPKGLVDWPTNYADPDCTQPGVVLAYGTEMPAAFTVVDGEQEGVPTGHARELVLERCRANTYVRSEGACVPAQPGGTFYPFGAETDAAGFAELSLSP